MIVWAVVVLAALIAGFSLWLVLSQPKDAKETPVRFVCEECGETHCNCYREEDPT